MSSNKYKKLLSDTLLFTVSNFGSKILIFFLVPLYTSVLVTEDYGIVDTISSMSSLFVPVLTLLISEAVLRFALDKGKDKQEVLAVSIVLILASTGLLLLCMPLTSFAGGEWKFLENYWLWIVAVYFFNAMDQCLSNYTRGLDRTKLFAASGILYTAVLIAANLLYLLVLDMGAEGYLMAILTADAVCIVFKAALGGYAKNILKLRFSKALAAEMLRYCVPMIPSTIAWWVMQLSDKYVVIGTWGLAASGVYSIAYKIPGIMSVLTNVFTQAWQISAIKSHGDQDNEEFVSNVYAYVCMFIVGISTVLIMLSKHFGYLLYAGEYFVAWTYVPILIVAYMFSGLSGVLASVYSAQKKTGMLFISTFVGAALNILLNLWLVPEYGVICAAYTTMFAFFVTWLVRSVHVRTLIAIKVNYWKLGFSFALLLGQAIVVSRDLSGKYLVSVLNIVVQLVLFRTQLLGLYKMIRKKGKKA